MPQRRGGTSITSVREDEKHKHHIAEKQSKKHRKVGIDMYKRMNKNLEKTRFKYPMNLQFFAETAGDGGDGGSASGQNADATKNDGTDGNNPTNGTDDNPSHDDLVAELARMRTEATQAQAERDRYKNSIDDLTKKNKELTAQVRATMTAEQQIDAAKKEAEEAKDKRLKEVEAELATIQATKRYMALEMGEQLAEDTAKAEIKGDMDTVHANIAKHIKAIKDTAYQQALKDRPDPRGGNGDPDKNKNASSMAQARAYAARKNGVNMDILNMY